MRTLGAPLGTTAHAEAFGRNLVEEKEKLFHVLPKLLSLQSARLLLYFCAVPRLNPLPRTSPPHATTAAAEAHDANIIT
eukprot:1687597-Pyramimonas_sp.AAC.1